jgi:hypothetical protein
MSKQQAQLEAIRRAKEKLAGIELTSRCTELGLPSPQDGIVRFRAFGIDLTLEQNFDLMETVAQKPAKLGDQILVLHYLLCDVPIQNTDELITFRDMPGGQFYWEPFLSRSIKPLLNCIGNHIDVLKKNLNRFDWQPFAAGDFAAKIHALGKINAYLVYHLGDEEFPAAAEMLFDSSIKRIYNSEDVAFLASRICIGLL